MVLSFNKVPGVVPVNMYREYVTGLQSVTKTLVLYSM